MKANYRHNFVLLIFIHLLIFAYPLASKVLHVHHEEIRHHEYSRNISLCEQDDHCPVCDFEFFSFIATPQLNVDASVSAFYVINSAIPDTRYIRYISYFSLRAPPATICFS